MDNRKFLIGFSIILVIIAAIALIYVISSRVPMNDENIVGNTPGNLYNDGLFLEMDGKVYFSNPTGSDCLYSMNPDESDVKQLTVMSVRNITGAGKYLYFYLDPGKTSATKDLKGLGKVSTFYGLYRSELDGENQELLDRENVSALQLVGSNVYYTVTAGNEAGLKSIRIDGKNETLVTTEQLNPSCATDGKIYYSGVDLDHDLHMMDTLAGNVASTVLSGNIWQPIVKGDYIYYIDAKNGYKLCRASISSGEVQFLTDERIDFYNMNDYNIFYATSVDSQALHVMNVDGTGSQVIADGVFSSLNLTSRYLYFKPYDVDNVMYHIPIDGSAQMTTFLPFIE